ncbi:hypothetical protein LOCC1_G007175 [Lachnellula occidentalis]|uniref:Uncharacterized protein n=1 Tax=Lachnellula occidentalis TaxID=215460 RepID=A0A8H8RIE0_9HELO|nr:hypothetical protein LOCC1_G007175 [Lachnellula occidentalis]
MPRKPRQQTFVNRPSPLAQVSLTRPLSQNPELGLVRDPAFWKRFSAAVHMEEGDAGVVEPEHGRGSRTNSNSSSNTFTVKDTYGLHARTSRKDRYVGIVANGVNRNDDWLQKQHQEKRRWKMMCISITLMIVILGVGAGVVAWYFLKGRK